MAYKPLDYSIESHHVSLEFLKAMKFECRAHGEMDLYEFMNLDEEMKTYAFETQALPAKMSTPTTAIRVNKLVPE